VALSVAAPRRKACLELVTGAVAARGPTRASLSSAKPLTGTKPTDWHEAWK
jgi:hypothetical protein